MKPVDFDLHRPATLDAALALLASHGDDARVLAGGQSLVPLLNFRLARPGHVVDIGRVAGLGALRDTPDGLVIGAMVRQSDAERAPEVAARCPLLAAALPWIAHPPVRARGTICGSLAHADPAAELPSVAVALDATLVAVSASGRREIPAAGFYQAYLTTALRPDELLAAVRLPAAAPGTGAAFHEVSRRRGDFAMAGVAAQVTLQDGAIADARICLSGVAGVPLRCTGSERALLGSAADPGDLRRAADAALDILDPAGDLHATAGYRKHVARRSAAPGRGRGGRPGGAARLTGAGRRLRGSQAGDEPLRVVRVDLLPDVAGKVKGRDRPAAGARRVVGRVGKALVRRFHEPEVDLVHGSLGRDLVGAEQHPLGMALDQGPGGPGLPAEFRDAGRDVDVEVRVLVHHPAHPGEIFRVAAGVHGDERRRGVRGHDGLERRHQAVEPRVLGVTERPVGAGQQFFEALVALVNRVEEGHRVGGVDGDRDAEPTRGVPQRAQPRVVGQDQTAAGVADAAGRGPSTPSGRGRPPPPTVRRLSASLVSASGSRSRSQSTWQKVANRPGWLRS